MIRAALLALLLSACAAPNVQGDVPPALECAAKIMGYPIPAQRAHVMIVSDEALQKIGARGTAGSRAGAALLGMDRDGPVGGAFVVIGRTPFIFLPPSADFATEVHEHVHLIQWANGHASNSPEFERAAYWAETRIGEVCG